jgi:hypothetical protein
VMMQGAQHLSPNPDSWTAGSTTTLTSVLPPAPHNQCMRAQYNGSRKLVNLSSAAQPSSSRAGASSHRSCCWILVPQHARHAQKLTRLSGQGFRKG